MKILVTGGAGYIGSVTVKSLLDAGHDCIVIDSLENGNRSAVDSRARFVKGNIGDKDTIVPLLENVDAVMHLAGYIEVGESVEYPEKYFHNNVENARVLLDAMIEQDILKMVFSSTAAVYGRPETVPIDEDSPLHPINPYGESKLAFERLLDAYSIDYGLESIRFRYFNVAGAWPDASIGEAHDPETHLIPNVIRALSVGGNLSTKDGGNAIATSEDRVRKITIFGNEYPTSDGTCVRDYIHVCDLAQAHAMALQALGRGEVGGVYNLGNGTGFSNNEVVYATGKALGLDAEDTKRRIHYGPARKGDPAMLIASSDRANERFGWYPRYGKIEEIIDHACAWHELHPHGYEIEEF
ncbi:MAG: UDP-glucose 4-epimerase GalE [Coriobacteriia bacterium]|nr:UDP-glucose 4-epimerase GalE [Coriobacteriia bacterium]